MDTGPGAGVRWHRVLYVPGGASGEVDGAGCGPADGAMVAILSVLKPLLILLLPTRYGARVRGAHRTDTVPV